MPKKTPVPTQKPKTLAEVVDEKHAELFQTLNASVHAESMPAVEKALGAYLNAQEDWYEKHIEEREDEARAEGRNDGIEDGRESAREEERQRYGGIHSGQVRINVLETSRRLEHDERDPFQSRAWQAIADAVEG